VQEALVEEAPEIFFSRTWARQAGSASNTQKSMKIAGALVREAFHLIAAKDRKVGARRSSKTPRGIKTARQSGEMTTTD
jgi:hypothetical protein